MIFRHYKWFIGLCAYDKSYMTCYITQCTGWSIKLTLDKLVCPVLTVSHSYVKGGVEEICIPPVPSLVSLTLNGRRLVMCIISRKTRPISCSHILFFFHSLQGSSPDHIINLTALLSADSVSGPDQLCVLLGCSHTARLGYLLGYKLHPH